MKVLVLGGGFCQLNMIKRLKKENHYIILADYLENNPGKQYADEHHRVSTFDIQGVIDLFKNSSAEAIVTVGTDQPVLTAAVVAEFCKVPFYINPKTAEAVTNKRIMKNRFKENGIPTVNFRFIGKNFSVEDINGINFPAVLKPVDSQGQRGIFKVENESEISLFIDETLSYSKETTALLEEYYPNDEITVNGWVLEGKANIISVVDRVTMEKTNRIGICIAHNYPSVHYKAYKEEISYITQKIVDSFDIKEGPLYFQFLIGEKRVLVNEIAMRIGGAYEDIAIPLYSGIDILGMVMDIALKSSTNIQQVTDYDFNENNKNLSVQLFFIKPGIITYITPEEEIMKLEFVKKVFYIVKKGDKSEKIQNATARAGYIIIKGSEENMSANIDLVFEKMMILDETGSNLIIKYSEYENKYKFV